MSALEDADLDGALDVHTPEPAGREIVGLVHEAGYLDLLERLDAAGGGRLDPDTRMGPGSLEAALRASQGTCDAVERVVAGNWHSAFVCVRPPGHHAPADRAMGFCLTNHVAVAARWAIVAGLAQRVAIVDWDAHHGNGTQDIFYADADVLYVSLHQYPFYPGTGSLTERGVGRGSGFTVNVPLPAGAAEDAYGRAFDEIVVPETERFGPDLVLVSAGYDAHHADPLCMMRLTAGAFHRFTRRVSSLGAGAVCVLEGGYDLDALGWGVCATISALLGRDPVGVPDGELEPMSGIVEALSWVDDAAAAHRA